MFESTTSYVKSFLPNHLTRQLRELYVATTIGNLAVAAVMIFEPIYLYRLGYSIPAIIAFYAVVYLLYLVLIPLGARAGLRYGYEWAIVIGSLFLVGLYLSFLALAWSPWFLPLAAMCYALQKSFYWPSFYYGFSVFGRDDEEGREVGNWEVLEVMVSAVGPFLGGLILYISNFPTLFVVASILILLSNIPLILTREPVPAEPFSYRACFDRLRNPEKRSFVLSFLGFGEEMIGIVFWPLFISIFYVGDLFSLGSLVALTTTVTIVIILYVGRISDRTDKRVVLRATAFSYSFIWAARLFTTGVGGVIVIDTLTRLVKKMMLVPIFAIIFERARHRQHAMATAVLFEQSLVLGKLLALGFLAIFFLVAPASAWQLTFAAAAIFTLFYAFL